MIFIIGAGAAGSSLAVALTHSGRRVLGVYDAAPERASALAERLGCPAFSEPPAEIREAELVLVAVSDSAVEDVARQMSELGLHSPSQIWLHVSGALPASVLSPLEGRVAAVGAFHPAHVFAPGQVTELVPGVCFGVDGGPVVRKEALSLANDLRGRVLEIPADLRPLYHAATVLASNCIVALLAEARNMLGAAGLSEAYTEPLLACLAVSATTRAQKSGFDASLSGPIRRGDAGTVKNHLRALDTHPDAKQIYETLGRALIRLTRRIGDTDEAALKEIEAMFGDE